MEDRQERAQVMINPIEWLEAQAGYWRGKALVRRPGPETAIWSEEALRGHRISGEYELSAEMCETIKKARES